MTRWAVVLAGGVGSRFWPLSTPTRPKQLLPLVTGEPLLADAVSTVFDRSCPPDRRADTHQPQSLVPAIAELLPEIPRDNLIAEPRAGGTAAALTWAAQEIARRDGPDARDDLGARGLGGRRRRGLSRAHSTHGASSPSDSSCS